MLKNDKQIINGKETRLCPHCHWSFYGFKDGDPISKYIIKNIYFKKLIMRLST
jgi:hypothetical protein